jgi:hypothetical protein
VFQAVSPDTGRRFLANRNAFPNGSTVEFNPELHVAIVHRAAQIAMFAHALAVPPSSP